MFSAQYDVLKWQWKKAVVGVKYINGTVATNAMVDTVSKSYSTSLSYLVVPVLRLSCVEGLPHCRNQGPGLVRAAPEEH